MCFNRRFLSNRLWFYGFHVFKSTMDRSLNNFIVCFSLWRINLLKWSERSISIWWNTFCGVRTNLIGNGDDEMSKSFFISTQMTKERESFELNVLWTTFYGNQCNSGKSLLPHLNIVHLNIATFYDTLQKVTEAENIISWFYDLLHRPRRIIYLKQFWWNQVSVAWKQISPENVLDILTSYIIFISSIIKLLITRHENKIYAMRNKPSNLSGSRLPVSILIAW